MKQRRGLIVDDHELFRGGLRLLLQDLVNFAHIDEVGSLDEALAVLTAGDVPDLVTFDLSMPGLSGLEGLSAMVEALPGARIVVVSASESRDNILGALGAGAHGYIPKSLPSAEIVDAVEQVLAGRIFAPRALLNPERTPVSPPQKAAEPAASGTEFTPRQRAVLDALLTGASTRKIARDLNLAEGTVKIHLAAIYRQLGVHSRAEVIAKLK